MLRHRAMRDYSRHSEGTALLKARINIARMFDAMLIDVVDSSVRFSWSYYCKVTGQYAVSKRTVVCTECVVTCVVSNILTRREYSYDNLYVRCTV